MTIQTETHKLRHRNYEVALGKVSDDGKHDRSERWYAIANGRGESHLTSFLVFPTRGDTVKGQLKKKLSTVASCNSRRKARVESGEFSIDAITCDDCRKRAEKIFGK